MIWDMTEGLPMILINTRPTNDSYPGVRSVAISSDGRLVAAGSYDGVRDLSSFVGVYSECDSYRRYVFGTLALVNRWRRYGDTEVPCAVLRSPLIDVDW